MTITVWGRLTSSNVQKVIWTLSELELPYEHVVVGGFAKGTDTAEYRAMNPNGLVPTIRDGDLVLWESNAIVRYLSAEYGSGLLFPVEPRQRAVVDQWADWTATTFQPSWSAVFAARVRTPLADQKPEAIAKAIAHAEAQFGAGGQPGREGGGGGCGGGVGHGRRDALARGGVCAGGGGRGFRRDVIERPAS